MTVVYGDRATSTPSSTAGKWDAVEGVAWTAYRRQNCTATYGCVNPWRQIYYDDAQALGLKYDLINRYNLRGAGIWALGYDGTRPELYQALKDKFITDTIPPRITQRDAQHADHLAQRRRAARHDDVAGHRHRPRQVRLDRPAVTAARPAPPSAPGRMTGKTVVVHLERLEQRGRRGPGRPLPDHDLDRGRLEQPRLDLAGRHGRSAGRPCSGRRPPRRPSRPTATADRSTRPVMAAADALVDRDRHGSSTRAARALRRWTFADAGSGAWTWDGRDSAGRTVADGRYTFRVRGLDRAGNSSHRDMTVRVDRTIRSLTLSRLVIHPGRGPEDAPDVRARAGRRRVTVSIYRGRRHGAGHLDRIARLPPAAMPGPGTAGRRAAP